MGQMDAPSSWNIVQLVSYGIRTQNQRRESGVTERLRSPVSCRSGTRPVLFFVWKKKKKLRAGRNCTWDDLKASVANIFKLC